MMRYSAFASNSYRLAGRSVSNGSSSSWENSYWLSSLLVGKEDNRKLLISVGLFDLLREKNYSLRKKAIIYMEILSTPPSV